MLHRVAVPMGEVVSGLMNRDQQLLGDRLVTYYHVIQESHLSVQLNQVMKKVAGWAR